MPLYYRPPFSDSDLLSGCQLFLVIFYHQRRPLHFSPYPSRLSPLRVVNSSFFAHFRFRGYFCRFFAVIPSSSFDRPLMPPNPEHPDAPGLLSARHLCGDGKAFSSIFPVSATIYLPLVLRIANLHPMTEQKHLFLSTATFVPASTTIFHAKVRPDPYLVITRPSDVPESCNAVVWDERRRYDIGSHVGPVFHTAAGGIPHPPPRPESSPDPKASSPIAPFGPLPSEMSSSRVRRTTPYSVGTAPSRQ